MLVNKGYVSPLLGKHCGSSSRYLCWRCGATHSPGRCNCHLTYPTVHLDDLGSATEILLGLLKLCGKSSLFT